MTTETACLGLLAAAGLLAIDVVYFLRGTIGPAYAGDAVLEASLAAAWGVVLVRRRRARREAAAGAAW